VAIGGGIGDGAKAVAVGGGAGEGAEAVAIGDGAGEGAEAFAVGGGAGDEAEAFAGGAGASCGWLARTGMGGIVDIRVGDDFGTGAAGAVTSGVGNDARAFARAPFVVVTTVADSSGPSSASNSTSTNSALSSGGSCLLSNDGSRGGPDEWRGRIVEASFGETAAGRGGVFELGAGVFELVNGVGELGERLRASSTRGGTGRTSIDCLMGGSVTSAILHA
jgi:hypothetical protein